MNQHGLQEGAQIIDDLDERLGRDFKPVAVPEGIVLPDCEEHRTLQDKLFGLVGDAESVEQSLERVTGKENLKIGLFGAGAC